MQNGLVLIVVAKLRTRLLIRVMRLWPENLYNIKKPAATFIAKRDLNYISQRQYNEFCPQS